MLALAVVATVLIGPDGWLIPPPYRKLFYRLTGTRFGKGIISIGVPAAPQPSPADLRPERAEHAL